MDNTLYERLDNFRQVYLTSPEGQERYEIAAEIEPRQVQQIFAEIREKHQRSEDITDDVLRRLLPHTDSQFHRDNDYRISTWPCIRKDVRGWFESIGWKRPEDWEPTALLLFEALDGVLRNDWPVWDRFVNSEYRRGFGTGFLTPILFCLDDRFPIINSKNET